MSAFISEWGLRHGGILQSLRLLENEPVQPPNPCEDNPGLVAFCLRRLAYRFNGQVVEVAPGSQEALEVGWEHEQPL